MENENSTFEKEIVSGLLSNPKSLPSKYFYDKRGNEIFKEIMNLDEYYVTKCEYEVLNTYKEEFLKLFTNQFSREFQLIELGSSDATKTKILLTHFIKGLNQFSYSPVDLSSDSINNLKKSLVNEFPTLQVNDFVLDYFEALDFINEDSNGASKIIMLLGSSLGNLSNEELKKFLNELYERLNEMDCVLFGFDLKKNPYTILNAYNDHSGVTSDFNLNLLNRINTELDADFNINGFYHYPNYDPVSGEAKSYLISKFDQEVYLKSVKTQITFRKHEPIFMEVSKKFDTVEIESLAKKYGFTVFKNFCDKQNFYCNSVWKKAISKAKPTPLLSLPD